jgi:RNA polymerase sigma factor (sigma-70 family)
VTAGERGAKKLCIVTGSLSRRVLVRLARELADTELTIVEESRWRERRSGIERRTGAAGLTGRDDRRLILNAGGHRLAERRAKLIVVDAPTLSAGLLRHADSFRFAERVARSPEDLAALALTRLALAVQAGSQRAFETLYTRTYDDLYGRLVFALRDSHAAQDLAHETLMAAYETLPKFEFRPGTEFGAWLNRVAGNAVVSHFRKLGSVDPTELWSADLDTEQVGTLDLPSGESFLGGGAWISDTALSREFSRLPELQRRALLLRFLFDLDSVQIGALLGVKPETVRRQQHRGIKALSERLQSSPELRRRRMPTLTRIKPLPVLGARRFALWR